MKKFAIVIAMLVVVLDLGAGKAQALESAYLNGAAAGGSSVNLWWSEVPGATYQVLYGPADNPMAHGAVLGEGESFTVNGLFANTKYVFAVKAVRNGEVSALSNSVSVWVGGAGRATVAQPAQPVAQVGAEVNGRIVTPAVSYNPAADTMRTDAAFNDPYDSTGKPGVGLQNLRTTRGLESGTIVLHWNDVPGPDAGSYNIVYTDQPGVEKWGVLGISSDARSYTVRGLTPGVRYYFWVSNEKTGQTPWVSDLAR